MGVYLGLDSSTQSLSAILIDADAGTILADESVNYGKDLPDYNCAGGVLPSADPLVQHADPLVWVAALDLLLDRMSQAGAPLDRVEAVSGSGQQHGSVYLNETFDDVLRSLSRERDLAAQLEPTLTRKTAPIWMDSSTGQQCAELTEALGDRLQQDTGSPAIERFTGPQIRRFYETEPTCYTETARIHLVSSFLCSVLCGADGPIDHGDGAGMNLMNLKTLDWDAEIAAITAPDLLDKLPRLQPSASAGGALSAYFGKYGLPAGIPVICWSGDNPNSLIGTGAAQPGTAVISLGTSDTFFGAMEQPVVDPNGYGHVFANPAGGFMSLICFKNGSLAREAIKNQCQVEWQYFDNTAFDESPPGNNGNLMLPYLEPEITPLVLNAGVRRRGTEDFCNGTAHPAVTIRAVVESQALTMRLHSQWMGRDFATLRVTGGASKSSGLCRVLSDVFQARIEKISVANSAGLGAAMRAANAAGGKSWTDLAGAFSAPAETVHPIAANANVYNDLLEQYREFEATAVTP